ncbi:type IV pilus assembly protein PilB [Desulfitispora alkaliphila]|uniref:GspE/PulE family protein n=1 Tax=Desulfitispora alkaliphila TaxID=622674 RepID=UPI003D235A93
MKVNPQVLNTIPVELVKRYRIVPIEVVKGELSVAMSGPIDPQFVDDITTLTGYKIKPCLISEAEIESVINRHYFSFENKNNIIHDETKDYGGKHEQEVKLIVDDIIKKGVAIKASDIHFEPLENSWQVRYRIDGVLQNILRPYPISYKSIVTRVKVMAELDIAESRLPLEGKMKQEYESKTVFFRVVTMPTARGEKIVLRILDRKEAFLKLTDLGYSSTNLKKVKSLLRENHGIILMTGPTGSGKTTTLYSMLDHISSNEKSLVSLEEPVEYELDGVTQININVNKGLTYPLGLKTLLRQDPDIIMVGEIRDYETAKIVIRAALTGHLVLSTIHTKGAVNVITRLIDLGIEPYLIADVLIGSVSQRLVRKVCSCQQSKGCSLCNYSGYHGRTSIEEVLSIDEELQDLIRCESGEQSMLKAAVDNGFETMRVKASLLVNEGVTTKAEIKRVLSQ